MLVIFVPAFLCIESNNLEKSTNNRDFFACNLFRIRRIVRICVVVDRFLRKPF